MKWALFHPLVLANMSLIPNSMREVDMLTILRNQNTKRRPGRYARSSSAIRRRRIGVVFFFFGTSAISGSGSGSSSMDSGSGSGSGSRLKTGLNTTGFGSGGSLGMSLDKGCMNLDKGFGFPSFGSSFAPTDFSGFSSFFGSYLTSSGFSSNPLSTCFFISRISCRSTLSSSRSRKGLYSPSSVSLRL
ncbi:hypothetical protein AA313_de0206286 [Arthrobotrys entomopaga]|nr:hypothetical protein AA313_de0206286 [Arthrobotrys entomopaga]